MPTSAPEIVHDVLAGLRIIDSDAHFTEPPDLWTSRVPASMKARVPVMKTADAVSSWFLEEELFSDLGGNVIGEDGERAKPGVSCVHPFEAIDPSAWDPAARVAQLDTLGLYAQILYPNAMGFAGHMMTAIEDVEQRNVIATVYNDWLMDVQRGGSGRLLPQVMLPVWDMKLTVHEMERLHAQGATGFTITDKPKRMGLPDLDTEYFAPMWNFGNEIGAVFNFHVGAGKAPGIAGAEGRTDAVAKAMVEARRTGGKAFQVDPANYESVFQSLSLDRQQVSYGALALFSNARIIVNLCLSNLFDKYPNIKIVSVESGVGWVPYILQAMEYHLDDTSETNGLHRAKRRPSEYFRDHIYVTFWFEEIGSQMLESVGVNNIMIETDIPHPTCLYPDVVGHFARTTQGWDSHARRRILQDNAVELYGIHLP